MHLFFREVVIIKIFKSHRPEQEVVGAFLLNGLGEVYREIEVEVFLNFFLLLFFLIFFRDLDGLSLLTLLLLGSSLSSRRIALFFFLLLCDESFLSLLELLLLLVKLLSRVLVERGKGFSNVRVLFRCEDMAKRFIQPLLLLLEQSSREVSHALARRKFFALFSFDRLVFFKSFRKFDILYLSVVDCLIRLFIRKSEHSSVELAFLGRSSTQIEGLDEK